LATYSTVMGLKLNDSSDPFALSDFTANLQLLDASPGIFICTSTSRPSWGVNQRGRLIFMTDLKQTSYWDGSAWNDLRHSAPVFAGSLYINAFIAHGTDADWNILTFTTPRPSAVAIILTSTYTCANNQTQDGQQSIHFDGVAQTMGYTEAIRFAGNSADTANTASQSVTSVAIVPNVSAGQHKIGNHLKVFGTYKASMGIVGTKVLAFVTLYDSGNVL
jgi:hypothetical protein